jgi:hypothetical protein
LIKRGREVEFLLSTISEARADYKEKDRYYLSWPLRFQVLILREFARIPAREYKLFRLITNWSKTAGAWGYRKYMRGDVVLERLDWGARSAERVVGWSEVRVTVGVAENGRRRTEALKLSIVEIFTALERTKRCAQAWAHSQPEHNEALRKFINDLDRIGLELRNSVLVKARPRSAKHGSTPTGHMHEIFHCLMPAITFAETIPEQQPEYTVPLKRFYEEVHRVTRELHKQISPGVFSDED